MAKVIPFKGIRYNPKQVGDLSQIVAPPYDVISEEEQAALCDRHPRNVTRLILGEPGENEGDSTRFYEASAERFRQWKADGTLQTEDQPALYLTSVDFTVGRKSYTRYGLIAYVRLEPFENRVVLPHERTSNKVKQDRLNLLKTTGANYCQIFSLYADDENYVLNTLIESVAGQPPEVDLKDDAGERHRLWPIKDSRVIEKVTTAMKDKRLYIADGHHRYETALNYRKWVAEKDEGFDENHPANYVMMYMACTTDPGLVILPTHRLLHEVSPQVRKELTDRLAKYFDIKQIPLDENNRESAQRQLKEGLRAGASQNTIGAVIKGESSFYLLSPKTDAIEEVLEDDVPRVLRQLDVTILTHVILIGILGYTSAELDEEKVIDYTSDIQEAIDSVVSGQYDLAFLLNATRNDQMRAVAAEGEIMPRKTTFYYPKVLTGLVLSCKQRNQN